jgi:hypothetical protein
MWARRLIVGSALAAASLVVVPGMAGAVTNCVSAGSMSEPTCVVTPTVSGTGDGVQPAATTPTPPSSGTSSLPFTGADVEGLAVIGLGAVAVGTVLTRRRRHSVA